MTHLFSETVAAQTKQIDPAAWDQLYIVGDVHGCRSTLERLLTELGPTSEDLVLFVGDLVRKGPDSAGVVDLVRSRPNFLSVRGNNEEKLLRGEKDLATLDDDDLEYLASLPVAITWDEGIVIHGGIDPSRPLAAHSVTDLQNIAEVNDGFWWESYTGPRRVFFGHKPLADPVVGSHALGLDTGCVYGNVLTAYEYAADRLISVAPEQTYENRAEHKWVHPTGATPVGDSSQSTPAVFAD
ncbi:serine/threonine protein phosphatase [Haloarcula sp. JP-Z28]|nr:MULTISPECIES: metallophosphoesterase family protein [Haloarcula]NHN64235.1 serine/threonine protein phosphatase [Haloarcula sp. JP-Z28]QUJ74255.1 serine/threonine protein phosphatase [Haloarcula sinaiiensis ATCC 33800]